SASASALIYSAMIAGAGGRGIALDSSNNASVAGTIASTVDFVTVNPLATVTGQDLFLSQLNSAGSAVTYSTYIDGHLNVPVGVAVDPLDAVYVAGTAFPAILNTDAFV